VILSVWLNAFLKFLLGQPRPFHLDSSLGLIYEIGNGLPSGHAQSIVVFLIPLAVWYSQKRRAAASSTLKAKPEGPSGSARTLSAGEILVWAGTGILILLVSFSRLYLGVHFPQDILCGWILGALCLVVFFFVEKREFPSSLRMRLVIVAVLALLMNAVFSHERILGAMFLGFAGGYAVMKAKFPLEARPSILRALIGFAGAVCIYLGLKFIFPADYSQWYSFFRFIRYAILGFWISAGAPWTFRKLLKVAG
jgi:hypothetical protein